MFCGDRFFVFGGVCLCFSRDVACCVGICEKQAISDTFSHQKYRKYAKKFYDRYNLALTVSEKREKNPRPIQLGAICIGKTVKPSVTDTNKQEMYRKLQIYQENRYSCINERRFPPECLFAGSQIVTPGRSVSFRAENRPGAVFIAALYAFSGLRYRFILKAIPTSILPQCSILAYYANLAVFTSKICIMLTAFLVPRL